MDAGLFQSPSLRGSGRFSSWPKEVVVAVSCFNPLHCGAVVASICLCNRSMLVLVVSIPFIAGQWSLHRCCVRAWLGRVCFNPLHCGAVVASRKGGKGLS